MHVKLFRQVKVAKGGLTPLLFPYNFIFTDFSNILKVTLGIKLNISKAVYNTQMSDSKI